MSQLSGLITSTMPTNLDFGQFDQLAENYAKYRPGYAPSVLQAILGLMGKPAGNLNWADVGAGTGLWTRMVAKSGVQSLIAVEPSNAMRHYGEAQNNGLPIAWQAGTGEATGLAPHSVDVVSMASSFHWVDFDKGMAEFKRIAKPGGWFVALWNPRLIAVNPLLVDIENRLYELCPNIQRKSSGRAAFTSTLTNRLWGREGVSDVVYVEGRHVQPFTPKQYEGVWRSVNDIQVQAGPEKFEVFMDYVKEKTANLEIIPATYETRCWCAKFST